MCLANAEGKGGQKRNAEGVRIGKGVMKKRHENEKK